MNLGQTFNEGIASGGFTAAIANNNYIFNPVTVTPEVLEVKRKGPTGISLAKQAIKVDASMTATVQVPFDVNEAPIWLEGGESFTDPDGDTWWVKDAPKERRSGETHMQNITCTLKLN